MRKLGVTLLAMVLVLVFTIPVFAFENIFGGYWRTRAFTEKNYSGSDITPGSEDLTRVDTRTQLFYTAKFSNDFQFVNKFEFNTIWGDVTTGGQFGTKGGYNVFDNTANQGGHSSFLVKHSYADFNLGQFNFKLGMQPITLNRGFLWDSDFAGATITYNVSKDIAIPFLWMKAFEGGRGKDANDNDIDFYAIYPQLKLAGASVAPIIVWAHSGDASHSVFEISNLPPVGKLNVYYLGADVDAKVGVASVWFTGLYEQGKADREPALGTGSMDITAYLLAIGGSADVQALNVHGQAFYASGDKNTFDPATDDSKAFFVPDNGNWNWNYNWAMIMGGDGIVDNHSSAGAGFDGTYPLAGTHVSNIMAADIGVTVKPMPKLALTGDIWYAKHAKADENNNKDLGTEVDLLATYNVFDNLTLDVFGAYLFAGDATIDARPAPTGTGLTKNQENPMLYGTRLSLSF